MQKIASQAVLKWMRKGVLYMLLIALASPAMALSDSESLDKASRNVQEGKLKAALNVCNSLATGQHKERALSIRSLIYQGLGKHDKAIQDLNVLLSLNTETKWEHYLERSRAFFLSGKMKEALADIEKAIELRPTYFPLLSFRAQLFSQCNEHEKAISEITRCVKGEPSNPGYLVERAEILLRAGRNKEALEDADKALVLKPGDHRFLNLHAGFLFRLGQHERALAEMSRCRDADRKRVEYLFTQASWLCALGRYQEALTVLNKDRHKDLEENINYWKFLGRLYATLQEYKKSISCYARAFSMGPPDMHDLFNRSISLNNLGKRQEAIQDLKRAIKLKPDHVHLYTKLASYYQEQNDRKNACQVLEEGLKHCHQHDDRSMLLGGVTRTSEDVERIKWAEHQLEGMIKHHPQGARAFDALGTLFLLRKDYAKSIRMYEAGLKCDSSPDMKSTILHGLARTALGCGELNRALLAINQGIELWPSEVASRMTRRTIVQEIVTKGVNEKLSDLQGAIDDLKNENTADASCLAAKLYLSTGSEKPAIEELTRAIARQPTSHLFKMRSEILEEALDLEQAESDLTAALSFSDTPSLSDTDLYWLYASRAKLRMMLMRADGAIDDLGQAARYSKKPFKELSLRGSFLMDYGRLTEALADFDKSIAICETSFALGRRGQVNYRLGNLEQAEKDLSAAIKVNPVPSEYFHTRAMTNKRLGRYKECVDDLNLLLKRSPRDASLIKATEAARKRLGR